MNAKVKAALIDHYIKKMGLPVDELAWRLGVYDVRTLIEIVNLLSERSTPLFKHYGTSLTSTSSPMRLNNLSSANLA